MRVALYAGVSTERRQERGTVTSQLEALCAAANADGHQVIEEFVDDGYSGARLGRPALDRLRDAAEGGVLDGAICLCADRLAREPAHPRAAAPSATAAPTSSTSTSSNRSAKRY